MYKKCLIGLLSLSITGCSNLMSYSNFFDEETVPDNMNSEEHMLVSDEYLAQKKQANALFQNSSATSKKSNIPSRHSNINTFVRGLTLQLAGNLQYVNDTTPMGITSFVFLDEMTDSSNIIGKQLTESFIHEVHRLGIPVIEHKAMDYIRVTQSGDYVLSRDYLELEGMLPINYVLTGTLVRHQGGYLVNVRVVGLLSKSVVGTAQGFLPSETIALIEQTNFSDGLPVTNIAY